MIQVSEHGDIFLAQHMTKLCQDNAKVSGGEDCEEEDRNGRH